MKKSSLFFLSLGLLSSMIPSSTLHGKFSLQRVYDLFQFGKQEAFVEKEYELAKPGILTLKNTDGNIAITAEWKRDTICLKATKKVASGENPDSLSIQTNQEEHFNGNHLIITSVHNNNIKGSIDYQLIVPAHVRLNLSTENGEIKVSDVKGPVAAKTASGDISIKNIANTVVAQTEQTGSIFIEKAQDNIKATANKGNITINQATKSIIANTQKGNIITSCNEVPQASKIKLNTETSGAITLAMPTSVSATVQGKTMRGRLTSDLDITLQPCTTKLNKQTRRELEKQVNGTLGTGAAEIQLTSNSGNIKILETQTT